MTDPAPQPTPQDDDDTLASEYVLGVLSADEMASCAGRRTVDPAFDRLVTQWEARLIPAAALVPPVPPPPGLLSRIESALGRDLDRAPAPLRALRHQLLLWRAVSATLAVACASILFLLARPSPQPTAAVLLPPGTGGFLVQPVGASVRFDPVHPPPVPPGRDLELWSLPAGAAAPRSLGVLPATGTTLPSTALPAGAAQLLVSLEPAGGSPTGAPTGPVLLATQLPAPP